MAKRGRKPIYDLSFLSCPNPSCPDHGKLGSSHIVSNGTYHYQSGLGRRYLCRTCGHSFCHRSGTAFEDLRSPEDKVIAGLKLLAKGMTLRRVGEILDVKPDTVQHWLVAAAQHREDINPKLLKEPGVTEPELDYLWQFVMNRDLRKRAILWRQRCGWRR